MAVSVSDSAMVKRDAPNSPAAAVVALCTAERAPSLSLSRPWLSIRRPICSNTRRGQPSVGGGIVKPYVRCCPSASPVSPRHRQREDGQRCAFESHGNPLKGAGLGPAGCG